MNPLRRVPTLRLPEHLPVATGSLTVILVGAYLLAPVIAESILGRPGSTAGLGFVAGPVVALLCGAVAFLVAIGLRWAATRMGVASVTVPMWLVGCVLLATIGAILLLGASARTEVIAREHARRPHVVVDSARIVKMPQTPSSARERIEAPLLFSIYADKVAPSLDWNGRPIRIVGTNEEVTLLDAAGTRIASTDLRDFDYIGRINALPYCRHPNGDHGLATLVTLRATSNRSVLIVYGADGAVIYREHLERTGRGDGWAGAMFVANSEGNEVLVVDLGAVHAYRCAPG